MKTTKITVKLLALLFCAAMIVPCFSGCASSKAIMTLNADNGKTYTATVGDMNFLMTFTKYNLFANNNWYSAYDSESLWSTKYEDEKTWDSYYTEYVAKQLKSILIEKYLFDKFSLSLTEEQLSTYKKNAATAVQQRGGQGAFKQYWGYTVDQLINYEKAADMSTLIMDSLYGDNGTTPVSDTDKETYYKENYKGYQYIILDMSNKIKTDEDGNRVRTTSKDSSGNTVENDKYDTVALTDEEKSAKALLPDVIMKEIEKGADFGELSLKYSDDYYSTAYPKGLFVLSLSFSSLTGSDATDVDAAVSELEIGENTEAISVGDGKYTVIAKRIELIDKVYDSEDYTDLFTGYKSSVEYDLYDKYVSAYEKDVVIDTDAVATFSMQKTFLSKYVDLLYYQNYYSSLSTQ